MSGNGKHPRAETVVECPAGHTFFVYGALDEGRTGECSECGWPFEILMNPEGILTPHWDRRLKSILVVDGFYSIRPSVEESALLPDVVDKLRSYKESDYEVALIGHSDMVAHGHVSLELVETAMDQLAQENIDVIDMIQSCYAHPRAEIEEYRQVSMFRPPNVGMLATIESAFNFEGYRPDWEHSLIVSDRIEAFLMAQRAGIAFDWSWEFFGRPWPFTESDGIATRAQFEERAVDYGRSPYCEHCLGREGKMSVVPVRRGSHDHNWRHLDRSTFGSDEPKYSFCEDPDWPQAAAEAS